MLRRMKGIYVCVCMLAAFCAAAMALPEDCRQVIVGTSTAGTVRM